MAAFEFAEAAKVQTNIVCRQSDGQCVLGQIRFIVAQVYAYRHNNKLCLLQFDFKNTAPCHSKSKGVCFHHDNARPHTVHATADLWVQFGRDILTHPTYNPYLAPSDFHLFTELKSHLDGMHFQTDNELKIEVERYLCYVAGQFYDTAHAKVYRLQWWLCQKIAESSAFPSM